MSNFPHRFRYQAIIGKATVIEINDSPFDKVRLICRVHDSETNLQLDVPRTSDVRIGDILTLYTEVLAQEPKPNV